MSRSSRKVIFRLTRFQRKNQQGTDGGTWRWSAPSLEDEAAGASQAESPCPLLYGASRLGHPSAAREQRARKKQKTTVDQWEEARQNARLRQVLSSGLSSEDEDEEQHGRGAEPGRWTPELYEPP